VRRPAGGLVAALDPLMQAVGGIWIAWGSGDRDEENVDDEGRVRVPPEAPTYTLRRLWLNQQDVTSTTSATRTSSCGRSVTCGRR
jgi:trehalose-6-phosphate synthase